MTTEEKNKENKKYEKYIIIGIIFMIIVSFVAGITLLVPLLNHPTPTPPSGDNSIDAIKKLEDDEKMKKYNLSYVGNIIGCIACFSVFVCLVYFLFHDHKLKEIRDVFPF